MSSETIHPGTPFETGSLVVVSLSSPREKFWGALLSMSVAGVTLRGIMLEALDDFARQLKVGDSADPGLVFFPMHRVERVELDIHSGDVPSLAERFFARSGLHAIEVFCREASE